MKQRILLPELMDDPNIHQEEHFSALRGLKRINCWTNNAALFWGPIWELQQRLKVDRLRVLDIATGGGDIPLQLALRAKRSGFTLNFILTDISLQALKFAQKLSLEKGIVMEAHVLNALKDQIDDHYDIVICSQFLHHLKDTEVEFLLKKMRDAALHRVIVVDLIRNFLNLWQTWLATRVLTRSKIVHFDGPQSIRASFSLKEMEYLVEKIDFQNQTLTAHWPCRFRLVGEI